MIDPRSREALALAEALAHKYAYGLDWRDLYGDAWRAIVRASELYDANKGPWLPYVYRHTRGELQRVRHRLCRRVVAPRSVVVSVASLSAPIGDGSSTLEDVLVNDDATSPETEAAHVVELEALGEALAALSETDRVVVLARAGDTPRRLVAAEHGRSSDWVRAIEDRTMRRLTSHFRP